MRALTSAEPPTRVATGRAAHLLFKPLSLLPDHARDVVLHRLMLGGGLAARATLAALDALRRW